MYSSVCCVSSAAEARDGWEERAAEGTRASFPGGAPLLFPDTKQALSRPGLRQWRRGKRD